MASDVKPDMDMIEQPQCWFPTRTITLTDIDERGDRILEVGTNKCDIDDDGDHRHTIARRFRVCSKALARSSPVMNAMLFGKFCEAAQATIHLPEDDADAMELLFHLAHGNVEKVCELRDEQVFYESGDLHRPDDSFVDDLYTFVVVADKYLMMNKLRPFISIWCDLLIQWEAEGHHFEDGLDYQRLKQSLWLASKFGHLQLYRAVLIRLAWSLEPDHHLFQHVLEPDGAADHIRLVRTRHINEALIPIRDAINTLMNDGDRTSPYCCNYIRREDRLSCQAHTLGTMIRNLNAGKLWPLPEAEDIDTRACSFSWNLGQALWRDYTPDHTGCTTKQTLAAHLRNLDGPKQDQYSMPSESVLETMILAAMRLNVFDYHEMYRETEVSDMLRYTYAANVARLAS